MDPASIRYNNPGAMYPGPSASRFGSTGWEIIGGGHQIATFPDPESGAAAQFDLLARRYAGKTLADAVSTWSGGNSANEYIQAVSRATGLDPNVVLTPEMIKDPRIGTTLAKAMARVEAGRDYPLSDEQWAKAQGMAFGGDVKPSGAAFTPPESTRMDTTPSIMDMLRGQQQQQRPSGLMGMFSDPESMAYMAMIAKGLSPGSSLDPQGMMALAQRQRDNEVERLIRLQQLQNEQTRIGYEGRRVAREEAAANEPKYITRPDGSIVMIPKSPNEGGAPTAPTEVMKGIKDLEETANQKDYNLYVRQERAAGREPKSYTDWRVEMSAAAVPEKAYDQKVSGDYGEQFVQMQKDARAANSAIGTLDQMSKIMDTPGFRSGKGATFELGVRQLIAAVGGDQKVPASMEAFRALANKSVMEDLGGLGAQISNSDRDYINATTANLENTPEGNKKIIEIKKAVLQRKQEMAALARQYAAKNPTKRLDAGFEEVAQKYAEDHPLFQGAATTTPAPGGLSPGSYTWDPSGGLKPK